MNKNRSFVFIVFVSLAIAYRVIPYDMRPEWLGAPQIALSVFAGSIFKNKKQGVLWALLALFISDVAMQLLHLSNQEAYAPGFYASMWSNYLLIAGISLASTYVNPNKINSVLGALLAAPFAFFILSNFTVWLSGGAAGFYRPQTLPGLLATYIDGLPFLKGSVVGTLLFGTIFFGIRQFAFQNQAQSRQPV